MLPSAKSRIEDLFWVDMTRGIFNWHYGDVTQFLKEHGFEFYEPLRGSHERWARFKEDRTIERIVEVNRSHTAYPPKTLKLMIKQSGVSQGDWIKWANS